VVRFLQPEGMSQGEIHHGYWVFMAFDTDTICINVWGPFSASAFLWIIIQCHSAIFKFGAQHKTQTIWL
jgi:hypothetical protein